MQVSTFVPEAVHFKRAFEARDLALPLLRARGSWEDVENYPGKVRSFEHEELFMLHRTPFQPVPISDDAKATGITALHQRDAARAYGLDVWWQRRKVLSLIWNDGGPLGLVVIKDGPWEEALAACARQTGEAVAP